MKFGPVSIERAQGKILAHNIARRDRRRSFRKGRTISREDVDELRREGYTSVYVAELEPGDVDENSSALRLAQAALGEGLSLRGPSAGRANLVAQFRGVLRVDAARLERVNTCAGISFATLYSFSVVQADQIVATVKIIPYALPGGELEQAEQAARGATPLVQVRALRPRRVGVIYSGLPAARERVVKTFDPPLRKRIEALGSQIMRIDYVPLETEEDEAALAETLCHQVEQGAEMIVLASETSTMDRHDILPRGVERAGGHIVSVGAPVDPGNLLVLAYLGEVPVIGAPGCVRSPRTNVVDWVLPPLLAGDRLSAADIARLGHGGLLEDTPRPMRRSEVV
jgi:molybdenum cofactor cytidylyltransferase